MATGWEGHRVRLVPLDKDQHFEQCLAWINDPDVTEWLAIGDLPTTRTAEEEWFSGLNRSDTNIVFAIELLNGTYLGNSGIHAINWRNGSATTGSFIGDPNQRGLGFGTEAAQVRAWYCFHVLGLRILTSSHYGGNELSARMQAKCGYETTGVRPKMMFKRGEYRDEVLTHLTRERWLELSGGNRWW